MGLYPSWADGCNVTGRHELGPGDNLVVTDVIQLIRWITPLGGPMRANVIPEAALLRKGRPWPRGHQATRPALHGDVRMRMGQAAGRRDAN